MTFVKLEVAVKAVEAVSTRHPYGDYKHCTEVRRECLEALRSLPTDDGWEDKARKVNATPPRCDACTFFDRGVSNNIDTSE